jgi:Nucleotidyl transferase AbiEii toxin, Type IV TA system
VVITRADIVERVREWQLTEEVVEKDYVLGWLLWGFGSDPVLADEWIFKGGTCLKKCYIETHRFSEDLDFTVLPGGPCRPGQIEPLLGHTLARVHDVSGINFSPRAPARASTTPWPAGFASARTTTSGSPPTPASRSTTTKQREIRMSKLRISSSRAPLKITERIDEQPVSIQWFPPQHHLGSAASRR